MTGRALYIRVGVLVLVGVLLLVGFVVFLLGAQGTRATTVLETYTSESVQGLDVGAPVRFRGVQIGRVTEIKLAATEYQPPAQAPRARAFQLVLIRFAVDPAQLGELLPLQEAVALGLRARITAQGITGVNYVELDFVPPDRFPVAAVPWEPLYPVLPSIPSTVAQVRGAAEVLVTRLTTIPLEQMATDLAALLATLNEQTAEGDLAVTLREAARAMGMLRAALEAGELEASLAELRAAAQAARTMLAGPELQEAVANLSAASADLRRTAERLPETMDTLERTMRSARGATADVQAGLAPIMADLRATTANLRAATDQLRASPSQLLFGAPPPADRRR